MTRRCRAPIDSNDSKNVTDPPQRGMIDNDELANEYHYTKQRKKPSIVKVAKNCCSIYSDLILLGHRKGRDDIFSDVIRYVVL